MVEWLELENDADDGLSSLGFHNPNRPSVSKIILIVFFNKKSRVRPIIVLTCLGDDSVKQKKG